VYCWLYFISLSFTVDHFCIYVLCKETYYPRAYGSRVDRVYAAVLLFFFRRYLKNRCSYRITKLDIQLFYVESWKPIYFGVRRSKIKLTTSLFSRSSDTTQCCRCCCVCKLSWIFQAWVFALLWVPSSSTGCANKNNPLGKILCSTIVADF